MDAILIIRLLFLLAVANGAPVIGAKVFKTAFARPLDGGALFVDGRPLFGSSKTLRGIVFSILATSIGAPLVGLPWPLGALVAIGAMTGDLFSSFLKRRMGRPASSQALGLDQIPESLFPLIACRIALPLTMLDIIIVVFAFFVGELVLSRFLFEMNLRDRPF